MSKRRIIGEVVLGAALAASPESAKGDWKEGVRTGNETMRTISDSATQIKDANTRRKQVEAEERTRIAEIEARKRVGQSSSVLYAVL